MHIKKVYKNEAISPQGPYYLQTSFRSGFRDFVKGKCQEVASLDDIPAIIADIPVNERTAAYPVVLYFRHGAPNNLIEAAKKALQAAPGVRACRVSPEEEDEPVHQPHNSSARIYIYPDYAQFKVWDYAPTGIPKKGELYHVSNTAPEILLNPKKYASVISDIKALARKMAGEYFEGIHTAHDADTLESYCPEGFGERMSWTRFANALNKSSMGWDWDTEWYDDGLLSLSDGAKTLDFRISWEDQGDEDRYDIPHTLMGVKFAAEDKGAVPDTVLGQINGARNIPALVRALQDAVQSYGK